MADFGTDMWSAVADKGPNMFVPWYLMASFAYYHLDESLMSDEDYDLMCFQLDAKWDEISHFHKRLLDRDALAAGTAYQIARESYPLRARMTVWGLLHPRDSVRKALDNVSD